MVCNYKKFRAIDAIFAMALWAVASPVTAQETAVAPAPTTESTATSNHGVRVAANEAEVIDKRIFGVLPNYRTADGTRPYAPITAKQKFTIASKDSFDKPVYLVSAAFAALGQLENSNPDFGQGMKGYGHRYVTAYADQAVGNIMTEGLFPSLMHEDPRYFRVGQGGGSGGRRTLYALSRILVTRTDSGSNRFNYSEIAGNSTATAISNLYYPGSRTFSDNAQKLGIQLATDAFSNVLKEFWPDVKQKFFKHKSSADASLSRP